MPIRESSGEGETSRTVIVGRKREQGGWDQHDPRSGSSTNKNRATKKKNCKVTQYGRAHSSNKNLGWGSQRFIPEEEDKRVGREEKTSRTRSKIKKGDAEEIENKGGGCVRETEHGIEERCGALTGKRAGTDVATPETANAPV